MANSEAWNYPQTVAKAIKDGLSRGRVSLFLGAGITYGVCPSWGTLIDRLDNISKAELPEAKKANLKLAAQHIRDTFYMHDKDKFLSDVSQCLYQDYEANIENISQSKQFTAITALIFQMISHRSSNIVTLNFDEIIENYLNIRGFKVQSIHNPSEWELPGRIPLYHPHGYLPYGKPGVRSDDIVLTQESFLNEQHFDRWSPIVDQFIARCFSIFIGFGAPDSFIEKLLDRNKKIHPIIASNLHSYMGIALVSRKTTAQAMEAWETRKIKPVIVEDWENDFCRIIYAYLGVLE